ncbi:MAG: ATP-binding protein [Sphingomonas bacterium]|nr:ATP-binding protein [Sphingomonas bacterium]
MKKVTELTEADLRELIANGVQESLTLEYKASAALSKDNHHRRELIKDISAFANAAGGLLIYGIEEADHLPVRLDGGTDPQAINREWIEQTLQSNIQPRIDGLLIAPIVLESGGTVWVFEIPQATSLAPHQNLIDRKYYKRFNFSSVAMYDYEVRDAMRRGAVSHPVIWYGWERDDAWGGNDARGILFANLANLTDEPMMYAVMDLYIDERLIAEDTVAAGMEVMHDAFIQRADFPDGRIKIVRYRSKHNIPAQMPIFRGQTWSLLRTSIRVPARGDYYLGYRIVCPGFSFSGGELHSISGFELAGIEGTSDLMIRTPDGLSN